MHILECKIYKGLIYVFYAWLKPLIAVAKWVEVLFEGAYLIFISMQYAVYLCFQSVNQWNFYETMVKQLRMPLSENFLTHCTIVLALNLANM